MPRVHISLKHSPYTRNLLAARDALLQERAHTMRFTPTESEARLWQCLRAKQLGVTFRRQVVIADYIADFAALSLRLIVEVDGPYHATRFAADARREHHLAQLGWRIVRVSTEDVCKDLEAAVALIRQAVSLKPAR